VVAGDEKVSEVRGSSPSLLERWRARRAADPSGSRTRSVLFFLLVALVAFLAFGDNPWENGIAERIREGKRIRPLDYWVSYGYWAAAADALLLALLLRFHRLWRAPGDAPRCPEFARPEARLHPLGWLLLALAIATSASLAYTRLHQSLWDDEETSVRTAIAGAYEVDDEGNLRFRKADLRDTFLNYRQPNNHIVHSLIARTLHNAWSAVTTPKDRRVDDFAVRLPAFLFGMTSLASLAYFLWRMGFPWAGVFGAWFLALHPWHLRYASEARGYSLVFTLIPLVWAVLLDALHHGTWRRWALFGSAQFMLLWAFPAALELLALTNLLALGAILTRHRGEARAQQGARWFTVNLFGAMLWAFLMAGNVAQLIEWLERKGARDLGIRYIETVLAYLVSGMPWTHRRHGLDPVYPELADLAAQTPWLFGAAVAGTAALLLLGALRLLRERDYRRWASLLLLLPGPLTWGVGYLRGHHMHAWYLVFALPLFAALVALGATSALRSARAPALSRALTFALCAAYLAAMLSWTAAPRSALRTRSVQPYKESVLITRGTLDPFDPGEENALTVSFSDPPDYYDPRVRVIERTEELRSWLERADREGRPLYVNLGRLLRVPERNPDLLALVEREDLFERVASLPGFEPLMSRKIFRYRPGSVALLDRPLISRTESADAAVAAARGRGSPGSAAGR
jgi:hypothetical protein